MMRLRAFRPAEFPAATGELGVCTHPIHTDYNDSVANHQLRIIVSSNDNQATVTLGNLTDTT